MDDYNFVPALKKKATKAKAKEEFKGLLGDDDESDDDQVAFIFVFERFFCVYETPQWYSY